MGKEQINCNHDEVMPVVELVRQCLSRDKQLFMDFSPTYNEAYFDALDSEIAKVTAMIPSKVLIVEGKKVTQQLRQEWEKLREALSPLESYLNKAGTALTAGPKDFLLSEIRDAINTHDHAGVVEKAQTMILLVDRNKAALEAKGFKAASKLALEKLVQDIAAQSLDKRTGISDKEKNTGANIHEINIVWDMISEICKDGKIIFAKTDPAKVKDYTLSHVLNLVRLQHPAKGEDGTTDTNTPEK